MKEEILRDIKKIQNFLKGAANIRDSRLVSEQDFLSLIYIKIVNWKTKYLLLKPTTKNFQLLDLFNKHYSQIRYINEARVKDTKPLVYLINDNIHKTPEQIFEIIKDRIIFVDTSCPEYQDYLNVLRVEKTLTGKTQRLAKYTLCKKMTIQEWRFLGQLSKLMTAKLNDMDENIASVFVDYNSINNSIKMRFQCYRAIDNITHEIIGCIKDKKDDQISEIFNKLKSVIEDHFKTNVLVNYNYRFEMLNDNCLVFDYKDREYLSQLITENYKHKYKFETKHNVKISYLEDYLFSSVMNVTLEIEEFYRFLEDIFIKAS